MTDEEFLDNFDDILKEHSLFGQFPVYHTAMRRAAREAIYASSDAIEILDRYSQSCRDVFDIKHPVLVTKEMTDKEKDADIYHQCCYMLAIESFAKQLTDKMISEGLPHISDDGNTHAALQRAVENVVRP